MDITMMDDDIEMGKQIFLRPVNPAPVAQKPIHHHQPNERTTLTKRIAQDLYYGSPPDPATEVKTAPVQERLGGAITKRRGYKQLLYLNQRDVKPRIKKDTNGITTAQYRQRAQQRLNLLRQQRQWATVYQMRLMQIKCKNMKDKYKNPFHLVHILDPEIQKEIQLIKRQSVRATDIEHDLPLSSEDVTAFKLHERFSLYP